jgi:hypothetical protein
LKDTTVFLTGAAIGLAIASAVYGVFFFVLMNSPLSDPVISGVTLVGIGLALGGYILRWRGDRSKEVFFLMGVGVGIVVVGFIGAGAGVDPYISD